MLRLRYCNYETKLLKLKANYNLLSSLKYLELL